MKFLADLCISQSSVKWLREQGHEAVHARDINLHRAADEEIIGTARANGMIVLTCDLDFGDIMAASREKYPSVLIFRLDNSVPGNINRRLLQVLQESYIALSEGALIIVEEARHRVRLLPV
jgi:predicted nuclease of predicted toxin-antitoxin system